jgi:hypothetical protein
MATVRQTCGPLYKAGLESFTGMDPKLVPIFAAGFVTGQAEKIFLGACRAAMFRPSEEWQHMLIGTVLQIATRYGLHVATISTSIGDEIWIAADIGTMLEIQRLPKLPENSPEWHFKRGCLCGISERKLDLQFHKRDGYGERCD